jgi:hypothetical protein
MDTAWCPTCRRTREVMDTYETDEGDRYVEGARTNAERRVYYARPLECGHDAGDGGGTTSTARPVNDAALVARVAALQEHGA